MTYSGLRGEALGDDTNIQKLLFAKDKGRRKLADCVVGGSMLIINMLEE
jgi:hypothetical protein